ncbi:mimecan [Protopterus annectens]|uniref:mimecan n=1 Tax=Protopterus annectens TaxID=7888 RepID=UPI001CFBC84E|nr:mimecan [Protopterus annectens]
MKALYPIFFLFMFAAWVGSEQLKEEEVFKLYDEAFGGKPFAKFEDNTRETENTKLQAGVISSTAADRLIRKIRAPETTSAAHTDLPTCLLCVCLSGSVYCEETDIDAVPPLPKETGYLYARFNRIKKINAKDFSEITTLKRIDLTGNLIDTIEEGAFSKLLLLEELTLAENRLTKLPALPPKLILFNANHNQLKSKVIKANFFKKLTNLVSLYLGDNALEMVPPNLPETLRTIHLQNNNITTVTDDTFCKSNNTRYIRHALNEVRLDGNPIFLAKFPNSFTCLKNLPSGKYF